jgi:hypothetical protein
MYMGALLQQRSGLIEVWMHLGPISIQYLLDMSYPSQEVSRWSLGLRRWWEARCDG